MGFLRKIKSPFRRRMKRKKSEALTLASTCDFTTDTTSFDVVKADTPAAVPTTGSKRYKALSDSKGKKGTSRGKKEPQTGSSTRQGFFSNKKNEMQRGEQEVEDDTVAKGPSEKCTTDPSTPSKEQEVAPSCDEAEPELLTPIKAALLSDEDPPLSSDSATLKPRTVTATPESIFSPRPPSLRSQEKEPTENDEIAHDDDDNGMISSLPNLYTKHHDNMYNNNSDAVWAHAYNDELSTLYEVPTDREDNDSLLSGGSASELDEVLGGFSPKQQQQQQVKHTVSIKDDSLIKARWDYALTMMCSEASQLFGSVTQAALVDEDAYGPDMAEI